MSTFDLDTTKKWVEIIAAPAALIALIFLWAQSCQMSEQNDGLRATIAQADNHDLFQKTLEFDQMMLTEPELYKAVTAQEGEPETKYITEADSTRQAKAEALATYIIDFYDYIFEQYPASEYPEIGKSTSGSNESYSFKAWSNALIDNFADSSLVCRKLIKNQDGYGDPFVSRLHKAGICPGLHIPAPAS